MGLFSSRKEDNRFLVIVGDQETLIVDSKNNVLAVYNRNTQQLKCRSFASDEDRRHWISAAKSADWGKREY